MADDTTPAVPGTGPSNRSTSLVAAAIAAASSLATTLIPNLTPQVQTVLIAGILGLAAIWIICSALVKRGAQRAGQTSAGAGLAAVAPHLPAIAAAITTLGALAAQKPVTGGIVPVAAPPDPTGGKG
jgi:hypothetical protein